VHLVFKTHFDAGFTDLADTVLARYLEQHIPHAIRLARELRESGGDRFVWTTGAWLIHEFLERAESAERKEMEEAIMAGDIAWHALPFTTHSELMTADLFRFGLGVSQKLDRRFGRQTIAAKMTDVPGHTRAIVPLLAEAGVRFLHIGVNPACPPPDTPEVFRWRDPNGSEVIVNYTRDSYGRSFALHGFEHVLAFAHSGDNAGPQSPAEVRKSYDAVRSEFPQATVRASTLDAFARDLLRVNDQLPIFTEEIGDTWIHGVATDPYKTACFRRLDRLTAQWSKIISAPEDQSAFDACRNQLLCIPEHTWGLDEKTHLGDYANYARADFTSARTRDIADAEPPEGLGSFGAFRLNPDDERADIDTRTATFSRFESSWQEQRAYLDQAVAKLPEAQRAEAEAARRALAPRYPEPSGVRIAAGERFQIGSWRCEIDDNTGALNHLANDSSNLVLADSEHPLFRLSYQTFSAEDYERRLREYNVNLDKEGCRSWAVPDFSKPGMEQGDQPSRMWNYRVREAFRPSDAECVLLLDGDPEAHAKFGMPAQASISLQATGNGLAATVQWFNKPANRMAEALWLHVNPANIATDTWRMSKMDQLISPIEVVRNGNRNLHAVEAIRADCGTDAELVIHTTDAALVSPGRPRLMEFDNRQPPLELGMHFNLYNNVWGTNFPMWYEENARFEFYAGVHQRNT
ncbi:MAG: DUF5054 domain-containing protein, partial [Verrucomicrobiota bacterium]